MEFRIADTFTDSLAKLTGEEQKAVKTTAFDLQMNPASSSMHFHRLDRAKDRNFWSVRADSDLRIIVHRTDAGLLLCYVDHHDAAYQWAARRKLETHPTTGAAQLVEVRERIEEIFVPKYVEVEQPTPPKPPLFAHLPEGELLQYGIPQEWLADVRLATEDNLFVLAEHLPVEASEALLQFATGGRPQISQPIPAGTDPFSHPDALRRFRVMSDVEELQQALEYPWEKWTVFLHPAQRQFVERDYNGPARVAGSAGTGKTVVALHRAVHLAHTHPQSRVLLTTFSDTLANALRIKLRRMIGNEPQMGERVEVQSLNAVGERLYELRFGRPVIAAREVVQRHLARAASATEQKSTQSFLLSEWEEIVDAWQLDDWESYREVKRLGRKTRLADKQRAALWAIFADVRAGLQAEGVITYAGIFTALAHCLLSEPPPFDFIVVDEAQDISAAQLRFLAACGAERPNALFFAGDLGQRIFQPPFSWRSLGIDIRGRSRTLHINYRTSHQIRMQADLLLGPEVSDVDGNVEERRGTVSIFNGPAPSIATYETQEDEIDAVGAWLTARNAEGVAPHEIGVFIRSEAELDRACKAVSAAGLPYRILDERVGTAGGFASICPMHLAKGLEFRAVAVMACDDEVIPQQSRIEAIADSADLEEVYVTERHLLYVACTRARDHLLVSSVEPASEFLDDLRASSALSEISA